MIFLFRVKSNIKFKDICSIIEPINTLNKYVNKK